MRVFITGGTGFIGSAVIRELLAAGHAVTALARTPASAERLTAAGATPRHGELTDVAVLRAAAAEADAVIHCGFIHDFTNIEGASRIDLHAAEAIIDGLAASKRPSKVFVSTSSTALMVPGRLGTERDHASPEAFGAYRLPTERAVLAAASKGVRSAVIRLPPSVHGAGDHGFVPFLVDIARKTGVSAHLGSGENRWPAVHRDDAAVLYRLAVEQLAEGKVPAGSALHGVAEQGVPVREIAQAIAERLALGPAEPRAADHFTWFAPFVGLDNPTSAAITQELTGWRPMRLGLLDDIRSAAYATVTTAL